MNILSKNLRRIALLSMIVAFLGCNEDDGVINGTMSSEGLFVGFTQTVNGSTGTVDFINISDNADSYLWDFGDGTTSIEINPSKTYENGEYLVRLTATNEEGESASFEDNITIAVPEQIALPISFDNANVDYSASVFTGAAFSVVANPNESGSNSEASNVGQIVNGGASFEGFFFELGTPIDLTTEKTIRMDVLSDVAIDLLLKLEEGSSFVEVSASHTGSGWETIDFDFSSSDSFSRFTFFVDASGTTAGTFHIDNIEQLAKLVTEPETAAPTPSRDAADVISLFSDAYTDVTVDTYRTDWSVADLEDVTVAGNAVKKYSNLDFVGIETVASTVDITSMTHIHVDIWSTDVTSFTVRLVDFGADGMFDGGDDAQADVTDDMPARGEWVSYDIPLSEFTQLITSSNMAQYIFVAEPTGNATVFVDNIYFYDENGSGSGGGGGGGGGGGSSGVFPFDFEAGETLTVFESPEATVANVANPDMTGINTSGNVLQMTKGVGAAWYSGVVFDETTTDPIIDLANGTVFKIKIWSPNAGINVRFQLEGGSPDEATTPTYNVNQTLGTANQWVEMTFDFTSQVDAADEYTRFAIFPDFDDSNQVPVAVEAIYYIDDITQE